MNVLVLNAGSSSIKGAVLDAHTGERAITLRAERLGTPEATAVLGDRTLDLSRREFALLSYLASRVGEVVSRIEIEDHLYDEETLPLSNVVASTIYALREKLEQDGEPRLIHTRRGLGYVLAGDAT